MIFQESFLQRNLKYLVVCGIAAAVLAMNFPFTNGWVKNQFYSLTAPFQKSVWNISSAASSLIGNVSEMRAAAQENVLLRGRITNLESRLAASDDLEKENQTLRQVLNIGLNKQYELKMAQVIGRDIAQDTLLVNKGSVDAVQTGFSVIDSNRAAVGRVVAVYANFSKVALLTGKGSSFDVRVSGSDIDGLVRGQGNYSLSLDLIPKDKDISAGSTIVTSSLSGIFPKDLVVGSVGEVRKNDAQMFQKAQIIPAFKIESTNDVFIVMGINASADSMPDENPPAAK